MITGVPCGRVGGYSRRGTVHDHRRRGEGAHLAQGRVRRCLDAAVGQDGYVTTHSNLFGGPPPTLLPDDQLSRDALESGAPPENAAAAFPSACLPWAVLAERALDAGRDVEGYAYARTGYHRALDSLRKNGWRGQGPVPWEHEPNRGFLRALAALSRAAAAIGETEEELRCAQFLRDSSMTGARELGL